LLYPLRPKREGADNLANQAKAAEDMGFPHGVSATKDPSRIKPGNSTAAKSDLENAGFPVHDTPTNRDPQHVTIELPKPVTSEVANKFNDTLGSYSV